MFTMNLTIEQYVKTSETNKHIQKLQKKIQCITCEVGNVICLFQCLKCKLQYVTRLLLKPT